MSPFGVPPAFPDVELWTWHVYAALMSEQIPLIVSIASLLVALASASISYMSLRASGPNVKLRAVVSKDGDRRDLTLTFSIHNRGMAAVEVRGPYVLWLGGTFAVANEDLQSGAPFPFELKPHSGGEWKASLQRPVLRRLHNPDVKQELYGVGPILLLMFCGLELGNGLTRSVRVRRAMRHNSWAARTYKQLNAAAPSEDG
jgi:hypothetical protein